MLIKNYGLLWRRDWISWGRGRVAGHLKGVPLGGKREVPIDFRDQQGVYILYDENFSLVYVGQAGGRDNQRLFLRLKQHKRDQLADRWVRFSWFGIRSVNQRGDLRAESRGRVAPVGKVLDHIEAILIAAGEPKHNRQAGRFGKDVRQYVQHRDFEQLGPEPDEMSRDIWKWIKSEGG